MVKARADHLLTSRKPGTIVQSIWAGSGDQSAGCLSSLTDHADEDIHGLGNVGK
jgi:hypothetical protein